MSTGNSNPSAEEIEAFILRQVRRIQPCSFQELADVTGIPDEKLEELLEELDARNEIMFTQGVSGTRYFSIYREVRL